MMTRSHALCLVNGWSRTRSSVEITIEFPSSGGFDLAPPRVANVSETSNPVSRCSITWKPTVCFASSRSHSLRRVGLGSRTSVPCRRTRAEARKCATPTATESAVRVLPAPTAEASANPFLPTATPARTRSRERRWCGHRSVVIKGKGKPHKSCDGGDGDGA
eukprot:4769258-Pleurochrysis_carterae.AAC.1